jgi:hypothetical protein
MFMKKFNQWLELHRPEAWLASILIAGAVILLAELAGTGLGGVRVLLGLYLFFWPVGALALKALKLEPENWPEEVMLVLVSSLSLIVLSHLALFLAVGLAFSLANSLAIIVVLGLILYGTGRRRA